MRTGMGLLLIGIGGILAFAVTTNTSVFNLHTAGYIIILIGLLGLFLPRRGRSWLSRRLVRRTRVWPEGQRVDETSYPPYLLRNQGAQDLRAGLPSVPSVLGDTRQEEPGNPTGQNSSLRDPATKGAAGQRPDARTEVIEDVFEE